MRDRQQLEARGQRVLLYLDDAATVRGILEASGLEAAVCRDLAELCGRIDERAGAAVVDDDVMKDPAFDRLTTCLGDQPAWSDLPLIMITSDGNRVAKALELFRAAVQGCNLTFIGRDVSRSNLVHAVEVGLRARRRQYEVRDLLAQREAILGSIKDPFFLLDGDLRFTFLNDSAASPTGKKPEELIGKQKWEVFPHLRGTPYARILEEAVRSGQVRQVEHFEPLGERWLEKRIYPSPAGTCVFGTDVTERRHAEAALRESEERFRLIIENAVEYAIFSLDLNGRITGWNTGAERLLGYQEEEILGRHVCTIFTEEDRAMGAVEKEMGIALETGRAEDERWHVRRNGSRFWAGGQIMRMLDDAGQVRGFVKILRDYTGRKRTEIWLKSLNETLEKRVAERTAEAEKRAGQLQMLASELTDAEQRERRRLAEVLHDHLQQILVAAKMQVGMLSQKRVDPQIEAALTRVDSLLQRSIDASRSLTVELSPPILYDAGLAQALLWLSRNMRETHQLQIHVAIEEEAEPESDDVRAFLFQAVRELLFNIVKHAGVMEAQVELRKVDDQIETVVADRGAGFDMGKKRPSEGRNGGFGLFSIRERVELLGGSLRIETEPRGGTRVCVRVPFRQPERGQVALAMEEQVQNIVERREPVLQAGADYQSGRIRILLADDHKILREGLAGLLREQPDFDVVSEASDGQMAVEMARETRPDVIVMDVSMPRLNGIEATRKVKEEMPEISIIALSMHAQEDMADAMRSAGAVAYVTKGAQSEILTATIRDAVSGKAAR